MTSPQAKAGCFSVGRCISPLERKEAVEAYRRLDEKPSDADRQASIRRCPRLGSSSGELETTAQHSNVRHWRLKDEKSGNNSSNYMQRAWVQP